MYSPDIETLLREVWDEIWEEKNKELNSVDNNKLIEESPYTHCFREKKAIVVKAKITTSKDLENENYPRLGVLEKVTEPQNTIEHYFIHSVHRKELDLIEKFCCNILYDYQADDDTLKIIIYNIFSIVNEFKSNKAVADINNIYLSKQKRIHNKRDIDERVEYYKKHINLLLDLINANYEHKKETIALEFELLKLSENLKDYIPKDKSKEQPPINALKDYLKSIKLIGNGAEKDNNKTKVNIRTQFIEDIQIPHYQLKEA